MLLCLSSDRRLEIVAGWMILPELRENRDVQWRLGEEEHQDVRGCKVRDLSSPTFIRTSELVGYANTLRRMCDLLERSDCQKGRAQASFSSILQTFFAFQLLIMCSLLSPPSASTLVIIEITQRYSLPSPESFGIPYWNAQL